MEDKLDSLVLEYGTSDPFELVEKMGINLLYHPLGEQLNGYYFKKDAYRAIVLNSETPRHIQRFTLGHEIAHDVLHANTNALFLSVKDRQEIEADKFSMYLLLTKKLLLEHPYRSIDDWAAILGLPRETVELRF